MAERLQIRAITRSYFGVKVLHGNTFDVVAGEATGLVGENGSGKSTSMNIIGGLLKPDSGAMFLDGQLYAPSSPREAANLGIAFIHQELNLFGNLSIEENIFIDRFPRRGHLPFINRGEMRARTEPLLKDVDLALPADTPVARLSQGEKQLVEIAKALAFNAKVVIFDEPTTSLTRPEVERLFAIIARLKARGIGIIYISHTLGDVLQVCESITILRDGAVVGNGRTKDFTLSKIISLMVGRPIDMIYPERRAFVADTVALRIEAMNQPGVVKNLSLHVCRGEVVGLAGLMGSGRSELARMIFGIDAFKSGTVVIDDSAFTHLTPEIAMAAGLAFLTEDRRGEGLLMDFSILENTILASLKSFSNAIGLIDNAKAQIEAKAMNARVQLSAAKTSQMLVKHLSGGNQQKVVIGKWLMRTPKVFILDEPTRGIDVGAKQEVYRIINALVEAGSAVLLISSEIEELMGLSDRILTIKKGELTGSFTRAQFDREALMAAATRDPDAVDAA